jgi:hypothetical protein
VDALSPEEIAELAAFIRERDRRKREVVRNMSIASGEELP